VDNRILVWARVRVPSFAPFYGELKCATKCTANARNLWFDAKKRCNSYLQQLLTIGLAFDVGTMPHRWWMLGNEYWKRYMAPARWYWYLLLRWLNMDNSRVRLLFFPLLQHHLSFGFPRNISHAKVFEAARFEVQSSSLVSKNLLFNIPGLFFVRPWQLLSGGYIVHTGPSPCRLKERPRRVLLAENTTRFS